MILGIGTDIIEICRLEKAIKNERFVSRCYTLIEREYLQNKNVASYAGIFAAKEAAVKALGTGFSKGIQPIDIEICHDADAKPFPVFYNAALKQLQLLKVTNSLVSISHSRLYATAICLLE